MLDSIDNEILIDVRTPEEYMGGHIKDAVNIDWNGDSFEDKASNLDKSKPVFVYCLAGSRSAAAAEQLRKMGFNHVYELKGGILKWRAEGFPEENKQAAEQGMGLSDYKKLLKTDKLVLVDFSAPWCGPCKRMAPFISEIEKEKAATLNVVKINTDDNQQLATELQIQSLPTLILYKNEQIIWRKIGYTSKEELLQTINAIK
ncbi:MAG: thioredoxin [Bacteroidetes bacterium]|nr:thioredoxin [Bacteroidota bacterium]